MKKYIFKYVKQESYIINQIKKKKETIYRWKCYHVGKYDNWCKQSDLIIDKKVL